jgi:hypothetical protein
MMEFKIEHDVDKGPLVRWMANQAMNVSGWLAKVSSPYADMYTAVWDDYEDESDLAEPHNQMGIFDNLEPLPHFERLAEDLI